MQERHTLWCFEVVHALHNTPHQKPSISASPTYPARCALPAALQHRDPDGHATSFLTGWDSMDHELTTASRGRKYGFDLLNMELSPRSSSKEAA